MFKTICWTNSREFRYRWNNYKINGRKYQEYGTWMQQHLFEHFSEEGHHGFLEDVSIRLIDKTNPSNPLQRKNYWRSILRQWRHRDWTLKTVSEIAFSFILTTGFALTVIRASFTETILVPITNVPIFITIVAVPVFTTLLFLLLLSPRFCWCSSCHYYWSWFDYCHFVALLLSLHQCFVLFNTYYLSSCFQYYHFYFCVIVVTIVLLLLYFRCPC